MKRFFSRNFLTTVFGVLFSLVCVFPASQARGGLPQEETLFTLWPLIDYRHDPNSGYTRWGFLGPLFRHSSTPQASDWAVRPLVFSKKDLSTDTREIDILYPLYTYRSKTQESRSNFFQLYQHRQNGSENDWTLFPFLFSTQSKEGERDFAFFPFGGTIHRRFGKDRIDFTLFPFYSSTRTEDRRVTHSPWPFFATIKGPGISGYKLWPLYGEHLRNGVYEHRYWLWPFFYHYQDDLDTEAPRERLGFFPFYMADRKPDSDHTHFLWPLFSWKEDRERMFKESWTPWPLIRSVEAEGYEVSRFLPFYSDEQEPGFHKQWILWPLYQRTEKTGGRYRKRDRVLFFLYSDLRQGSDREHIRKERVALWPLFTWEKVDGVERFYCLSLLEPFFPENRSIDRSWGPLWRLYQSRTDADGTRARSFLWNLYWEVSRGDDTAYELFPLFQVKKQVQQELKEVKLLKGLLGFRTQGKEQTLYFLFMPIPLGKDTSFTDEEPGT